MTSLSASSPWPTVKETGKPFVCGVLYELPGGDIARAFGAGPQGVRYRKDDDQGPLQASHEETLAWRERQDLDDFPNARDPVLPYVFDLFWDIKRRSELVRELKDGHVDQKSILEEVARHGLDLGLVPQALTGQINEAKKLFAQTPMSDDRFAEIGRAIAGNHLAVFKDLQRQMKEDGDPATQGSLEGRLTDRASFLKNVAITVPEIDLLIDKLQSHLGLTPAKNPLTDAISSRAKDALDFLGKSDAKRPPKLRPKA